MTCSSILPIVLFALALTGVVRANDQQTQQACVNAAICLLAVRYGLSPDRRPDLQAHFMSSVFRECRGLVRSATPRYPYCLRFRARARAAPRPAVFDPAAPARSYRVGAARPDRKPLAEGGCGGCALWDFRLGDRAPDPWACGRRTARGERRETRRLLINRRGSSLYEESDPKERLRVSNWIVQRLLSDCEGARSPDSLMIAR